MSFVSGHVTHQNIYCTPFSNSYFYRLNSINVLLTEREGSTGEYILARGRGSTSLGP